MENTEDVSSRNSVVDVILHEYDALRAEIVSRSDARFQIIGFLSIAATLLGTQISEGARGWLIGVTLGGFIAIWLRFGLLIRRCAGRLREIENFVNKELGSEPLVWENRQPRGLLHKWIR